ncbi:hypothetical protein C1A50_2857 [Paenibacillus polymyxa]|nr:hypothetical protein C1A50_2857 [Paenibacillus polymyxa]
MIEDMLVCSAGLALLMIIASFIAVLSLHQSFLMEGIPSVPANPL